MKIQSAVSLNLSRRFQPNTRVLQFSGEGKKGEVVLPIKEAQGRPYLLISTSSKKEINKFGVLMDTGSNATILKSSLKGIKRTWRDIWDSFSLKSYGVNGKIKLTKLATVNKLQLGKDVFSKFRVSTEELGKSILGLDLLNQYQFTLDMRNKTLSLNRIFSGRTNKVYWLLDIKANGQVTYFLVDTGASLTVILPSFQKKLNLSSLKEVVTIEDAFGELEIMTKVCLDTLEFQGHKLENVETLIAEVPLPKEIGGILGMDVLSQFICEFDPISEQVMLTKHDEDK